MAHAQALMHLVVFDIDGTLVDSDEFDARLYVQAVRTVLGIDIDDDWSRYRNVTDSGILDQILDENGWGDQHGVRSEVKETFVDLVSEYLSARDGLLLEIPGAKALVERLRADSRVSVAVATGGWEETAMMKLRAIGLNPGGLAAATASDSISRVEIMRCAEQRALSGQRASRRTYFGDGPWDKRASTELGYDFIAVGSNVEHPTRYPDLDPVEEILSELGLAASPE